jgi:outer membrane immunogenic protein
MRKVLGAAGASLGAVALATGAHAADLGAQPAYKAPAPWNWTGFYVGGTIGGVWSSSESSNDTFGIGGATDMSATGVIGGVEGGYNYQIGHAVFGVEGDISWSSLNAAASAAPDPVSQTYSSRLNALATVRGRIGWAFDRLMVFGTGGAAFANLRDQFVWNSVMSTGPGADVAGWTAGAGVEYALTNNWTVKAEYLHIGLPDRTVTAFTGDIPYSFAFKNSFDIGRVGINYKF